MLHQIPFHARWLDVVSQIVFVLNIILFLLFTFITILRYAMYPQLFPAVLRPTSKLVSGNVSGWTCDPDKHDRTGLRSLMGSRYGDLCLGVMVDR